MDQVLLTIQVLCQEAICVEGQSRNIIMIPFTCTASGPYFNGQVIGPAVDTQKRHKDGSGTLSARYMLEGKDAQGRACRVFIENQGSKDTGFKPMVVTDSPLLAPWETADLYATVVGAPGGVTVTIYQRA